MNRVEIEKAFEDWYKNGKVFSGSNYIGVMCRGAFEAGADFATKRHIKDIEPIKERLNE